MISLKPYLPDSGTWKEDILSSVSPELREYLLELLLSALEFISESPDCELGACVASDCLIIRIYDGAEYYFYAPFMLSCDADFLGAVRAVGEYSVKEEIPLVFTDVDEEMLEAIESLFLHVNAEFDEYSDAYRVEIFNELMLAKKLPRLENNGVLLTTLDKNDAKEYKRLATDEKTNEYWGYDYRADNREPDDEYFYLTALADLERGASVSFALRYDDKFIGEAVIQAFDLTGGADVALRLLPEYRGKGLGALSLRLLLSAAGDLGLKRLTASVFTENAASVALFSKYMKPSEPRDGKIGFTLDL